MKLLYTTLLFSLFASLAATAQTFAPLGAEWYFDAGGGIFHLYVSGDTVIDNIPCRSIVQHAIVDPSLGAQGFHIDDLPTRYVYNNSDTVFVYNTFFNKFTPLYIFNVHAGDTVTIPILPTEPGYLSSSGGDSAFSYIVDSVGNALYDTATFKTVYTHPIQNTNGNDSFYTFAYGDSSYIMTIGQMANGLLPFCNSCIYLADASIQPPGNIRCYHDSTMMLKFTSGDCEAPESVNKIDKPGNLMLYPIPSNNVAILSNMGVTTSMEISVTDMLGRVIMNMHGNGQQEELIDVSHLPDGLYVVKAVYGNNIHWQEKLVVQH